MASVAAQTRLVLRALRELLLGQVFLILNNTRRWLLGRSVTALKRLPNKLFSCDLPLGKALVLHPERASTAAFHLGAVPVRKVLNTIDIENVLMPPLWDADLFISIESFQRKFPVLR
jgi:hypothetical protein